MNLFDIQNPAFLKNLTFMELNNLASAIRAFLIHSLSKTGGHLSSNLGIVELTIAMHTVFDSPKDKIIFDVGHQSYTHKILTGRIHDFDTLRQKDGMSGFQKRKESEHDCWEAGHSSTSLSAALGFAAARDLLHEDYEVIAVIGDGALTGGMTLEALNDLGAQQRKVIIIFNDNKMSISKNSGGMEQAITRVRSSSLYRNTKKEISSNLSDSAMGKEVLHFLHASKDYLKHQMIDAPLFSQFNLDYIGPVDGHNIQELVRVLKAAREHDGPIVVHVLTEKGKGYRYAQQDTIGQWHGVGPFDIGSGRIKNNSSQNQLSWSQIISDALIEMAQKDERITAITPAMAYGSKLLKFQRMFPARFFDCGIAEEHAITMASGMAAGGLRPFVSIYSSFLQRAYDQILHDAARMDLPVVVGIDRAGLVGEDGETHQGIYDIAFLTTIPNVIVSQPKDAAEARNLLYSAFHQDHPYFIRYPKGTTSVTESMPFKKIETGTWSIEEMPDHPTQIVLAYGPAVTEIAEKIRKEHLPWMVVNARFFKPLDEKMLKDLEMMNLPMTIYEPDTSAGGLSMAVQSWLGARNLAIETVGLDDAFIEHGSVESLLEMKKITLDDLFERIRVKENRKEEAFDAS